ncbi:MAG: immunoglobulin domain-containing protein, partial [Limisphaerales bacterium]
PLTDDGRIAGSTTTNLTIAQMTVADAGSYSLVASNAVGAATSSAATLTPGFPPGITIPPQNQFVPLNGTTSLSVNVAGTVPLTYQWYRGIFRLSDGAQYSGTQTPTLTITNASAAQQGSYTVVARNAFGVTNASATVTVVAPPTITGNPTSATIIAGSNATFQVTISGSQLVDQWFFNGAPLTNGGRVAIVDQSVSAGTNKSTLTIASAQDSDAGSYWLVAANIAGSVTSSVGTLTVVHRPAITQQPPARQNFTNGNPATLTVGATGSDPLSYQWYHATSKLTDDGRIIGSQTSTLTFTNATGGDSGGYTVVVTNVFGTVTSSNSVLNVYTPPTAKPFLARSVPIGLPTVFTANVSGDFPMYYQWRLNGSNIGGATNFTYTIASMTTNDVGSYSLLASNLAGVAVSPDAMLTVGPVVGFGNNVYNQCIPPAGLSNVVAVAAAYGGFAVTADGAVVEWGSNPAARAIPADFTNIVGLAVAPDPFVNAADVAIALRADGTVSGVSMSAPATWTNIVAVACNLLSSYALRSDGIVLSNDPIPTGLNNVVAISASETQVMALRNNGTVIAWQYGLATPTNVAPALTNVVAIASGYNIGLAAKSDGSVVAWGTGATALPSGLTNVVAVAATQFGSGNSTNTVCAALRANGKVTFWGGPISLPTNVVAPASISNATAIAVGYTDGLALVNDGSPQLILPPVGGTAYSGRDFMLISKAVGSTVITYQWLRDGSVITGATNATLALTNMQSTDAGNYQVVVSNALGSVTSVAAPVKVTDMRPWLGQQPINHTNFPGTSVDLGVPVNGSGPMTYTWRFVFNGTTNTTNIPTTNSSLVLNPVRLTDAGTYTLIVSNAFGSATSQQITLTVRPIIAWGDNTYGQTNIPTSLNNPIAICGG